MRGCARGSLPDAVAPNKKPGISAGRLMSIRRNLSGGFVLDGCVVTFGVGIVTLGIAFGAAFRFSLGAAARALGELAFDFLDRLGLGWSCTPVLAHPNHEVSVGRAGQPVQGSIRTPGFNMPFGSSSRFAPRSARAKSSGRCLS